LLLVFIVQLFNKLLVNQSIDVFAELVQQEPISEATLSRNSFDHVPGSEASTSAEQNFPQTRNEDGNKTVDNLKTGDDADDDEPKPEENVDFFIDDVERQDAETVEFLHSSGGTEFVEGAFE